MFFVLSSGALVHTFVDFDSRETSMSKSKTGQNFRHSRVFQQPQAVERREDVGEHFFRRPTLREYSRQQCALATMTKNYS